MSYARCEYVQSLAARARDADAFGLFYRRYLLLVVAFALLSTGESELTADFGGEVFAAVLASCARYDPCHASAGPWLIGRALVRRRRRRHRGTRCPLPDPQPAQERREWRPVLPPLHVSGRERPGETLEA